MVAATSIPASHIRYDIYVGGRVESPHIEAHSNCLHHLCLCVPVIRRVLFVKQNKLRHYRPIHAFDFPPCAY